MFRQIVESGTNDDIEVPCMITLCRGIDTIRQTGLITRHGGITAWLGKKSLRLSLNEKAIPERLLFANFPADSLERSVNEVVLHCAAYDFSRIRNYLSMYLLRKTGGLAPSVDFAQLTVNNNRMGLYVVVERIDSRIARRLLGHENFDLLKASRNGANLYTYDWDMTDGRTAAEIEASRWPDPLAGFDVKHGDSLRTIDLISRLGHDTCSFATLSQWASPATRNALILSQGFSAEHDMQGKNYYLLLDRETGRIEIIRWDAEATWGRWWQGEPYEPLGFHTQLAMNGLTISLSHTAVWPAELRQYYTEKYSVPDIATELVAVVDSLETLLAPFVADDINRWNDTLITSFVQGGLTFWESFRDSPVEKWHEELTAIRLFIRQRSIDFSDTIEVYGTQ